MFLTAKVIPHTGTVGWNNDTDLAVEFIYEMSEPANQLNDERFWDYNDNTIRGADLMSLVRSLHKKDSPESKARRVAARELLERARANKPDKDSSIPVRKGYIWNYRVLKELIDGNDTYRIIEVY